MKVIIVFGGGGGREGIVYYSVVYVFELKYWNMFWIMKGVFVFLKIIVLIRLFSLMKNIREFEVMKWKNNIFRILNLYNWVYIFVIVRIFDMLIFDFFFL